MEFYTIEYVKELESKVKSLTENLTVSDKRAKVLKAENARLYKCIDAITVERLKMAQYIEFLTLDNANHIQDKQELLEEIQELQHMLDPRHKKMKQGVNAAEKEPIPTLTKGEIFNLETFIEQLGGLFRNE